MYIKSLLNLSPKCSIVNWNQVTGRGKEIAPSISFDHQFILFYRINEECIPFSLFCEKASENGEYNVMCKYTKKSFSILLSVARNLLIPNIFRINSRSMLI